MDYREHIRSVLNFPKEGIDFKDITTLLKDPKLYQNCIEDLCKLAENVEFDLVVSPEARGFMVGAPVAFHLGKGFVPIRKPGKLPYETLTYSYELEYGTDSLEMHIDAVEKGQKVILCDDLLATGGTLAAAVKMVEKMGGEVVGVLCLIELKFLEGRARFGNIPVKTLIQYE